MKLISVTGAIVVVGLSVAAPVSAQEEGGEAGAVAEVGAGVEVGAEAGVEAGLPLPWAQRPLTLTLGTLRIDGAFSIERFPDLFDAREMEVIEVDPRVLLSVGAAYGIHEDFEVGATVLPVLLSPVVRYDDPEVYAIFRFLRGQAELGAMLRVIFPVRRDARIDPGMRLLLHIGEIARLDVGLFVRIAVRPREDDVVSLLVPVAFALNVTDSLYFGVESGLVLSGFEDAAIPTGFFAGYTIPASAGGPLVDIEARFGWPELFTPGQAGDDVRTYHWQTGLAARVYIDLI